MFRYPERDARRSYKGWVEKRKDHEIAKVFEKVNLGTVLLNKREASTGRTNDYRKRNHLQDLRNTSSGKASARKPNGQP